MFQKKYFEKFATFDQSQEIPFNKQDIFFILKEKYVKSRLIIMFISEFFLKNSGAIVKIYLLKTEEKVGQNFLATFFLE